MPTKKDKLQAIADAKAAVKAHPMCVSLEETDDYFLVNYPEGYRLYGCRAEKGIGQRRALASLLKRMEADQNRG